jgi:hypothetical protein
VELKVYRLGEADDSLLIIPQLVTRTREITRAVVRIEGDYATGLKVNIDTDLGAEPQKVQKLSSGRNTLTAQDHFEQLGQNTDAATVAFAKKVIADSEQTGMSVSWNIGSFGLHYADPLGSGIKLSIVTFDKRGQVKLGYAERPLLDLNIPLEVNYNFCADTAGMLPGLKPSIKNKGSWNRNATISELEPVYGKFMERIKIYLKELTAIQQQRSDLRSM